MQSMSCVVVVRTSNHHYAADKIIENRKTKNYVPKTAGIRVTFSVPKISFIQIFLLHFDSSKLPKSNFL